MKITTKKTIYGSIVQSVLTYGAEVWDVTAKNKLLSYEMDYLRRSCRLRRVDRLRNETIRNMMGMERDIVNEVQRKQLVWYGNTCRMDEERIPNRVLQWTSPEKRRKVRPRRCWMEDVNEAMRSRNLMNKIVRIEKDGDWVRRSVERRSESAISK